MCKQNGLLQRGRTFYFQARIPKDCVAHFSIPGGRKRTIIRERLTATTHAEAKAQVRQRWAELEARIADIRRPPSDETARRSMPQAEAQRIAGHVVAHCLLHDEEARIFGALEDPDTLRRLEQADIEDRNAIARGHFEERLLIMAEDWMREFGYELPLDSADFRRLVYELAKASRAASEARRARSVAVGITARSQPLPLTTVVCSAPRGQWRAPERDVAGEREHGAAVPMAAHRRQCRGGVVMKQWLHGCVRRGIDLKGRIGIAAMGAALCLVAASSAFGQIVPLLQCVDFRGFVERDRQLAFAVFSYDNGSGPARIECGDIVPRENFVHPPPSCRSGQPSDFFLGFHASVFGIRFNPSDPVAPAVTWHLDGADATADRNSPPCWPDKLALNYVGSAADWSATALYKTNDVVGFDGRYWRANRPSLGVMPAVGLDLHGNLTEGAWHWLQVGDTGIPPQRTLPSLDVLTFPAKGPITVVDGAVTTRSVVTIQYVGSGRIRTPAVVVDVGTASFTATGDSGAQFRYVIHNENPF